MLKAFPDALLKKSRVCLYSVFLLALFPLLALPSAAQRAGTLDTSFSDDGVAFTSFNPNYVSGRATGGIAVQSDNKVVAAGYALRLLGKAYAEDFAVARFNADGTLDESFGTGGKVTTFLGNNYSVEARAIAVQPDGKIVVGGFGYTDFAVVRYNANGSLDTSFNGTGIARTGFEEPFFSNDVIDDLVLQPDGKIIVVGNASTPTPPSGTRLDFAVVRYNADGSLDETFNASGKLKLTFGNGNAVARGVVLRTDGKIVIIGWTTQTHALGVARLNPDGSPDTTFDQDGKALISLPGRQIYPWEVALQPDNKIIVPFQAYDAVAMSGFSLIRLNENGTLDQSFDGDGVTDAYFDNGGGIAYDVAVQPDGKIVAAGNAGVAVQSSANFAVARFNPNGSLDFTFGTGGKTISDFFGNEAATSVAIAPDGKIVLGGFGGLGSFIVARYHASSLTPTPTDFDYDGDGKADISVFRPSAGDWYLSRSSDGAFAGTHFGADGDLIAPADFDGDGKTDICVFRPSEGSWYRLNSSDNSFSEVQFGAVGDLPVPGDFDGDGRADVSIYRPAAGSWYRLNSNNNQSVGIQFGIDEDKPLVGDFDGDGKSDLTVFRPSNGTWYRINSSNDTFSPNQFGTAEDKPVPADYDGDGKTDLAVYRPSVGDWYIINSSNSAFTGIHFGVTEDKPAPADFDGDGKTDLVVFRPSSGTWYLLRTAAGFTGFQFGASGDIPTPNAYVR
jgi:uncharacterized delta-60 repeat protein